MTRSMRAAREWRPEMGRVNCYLPDELKEAFEAIDPPIAFSAVLRAAVIEQVRRHGAASEPEPVVVQ